MGLEKDAVKHISEILMRVLFEILEKKPESGVDLLDKVRATFPSALTNFVAMVCFNDKYRLTFTHLRTKFFKIIYMPCINIAKK